MSDDELAATLDAARADERARIVARVGAHLVAAEFRAEGARIGYDPSALLEAIDARAWHDDDGVPDTERIAAHLARLTRRPR